MLASRLRPRHLGLAFVLLLATVTAAAHARAVERAPLRALDDALRDLAPLAHTGVLYDRVLPLARLDRLDGGTESPVLDAATWRQAWDELRRSTLGVPLGPDLDALADGARASARSGVIPLALFDVAFERLRPGALEDGSVHVVEGRLMPVAGTPLIPARAVAGAVLAPRTYRGADVTFELAPERFLTDLGGVPRAIELDLADGRGLRPIALGERVRASYTTIGRHELRARLTRADGSVAETRFAFEVAALAAPLPDDTLHVAATIPFEGRYGTGDAYIYRAPGHTTLVNPVVLIEGFDLDNSMGWDELYALLDQQGLIESLRADGFDAVVLDFTDATEPIQHNAFVVAELIQQVQAAIDPQTSLALVGASMGGLCSRYALAWMETHALPHRVRTWISFDGPQSGADIPLGLQYWISFFSGQSADAAAFLATLQRPAARQLLLYHLTSPPGTTGEPDPLRTALLADLAAVGDYPTLTRRVAIANGSGGGQDQGFAPGAQLIRYEYSSLLASLKGNVWAVPDQVSGTVFDGSIRILFSTTSQKVTVSGTRPWDGAPGGSRASMTQLDTTAAPYGDIVALHPSHCFIPSVSALGLATTDPFFDIDGAPDLLTLSPFDAVYFPAANEEHVDVSPTCATWVRDEVAQGVVSVPDGPDGARRLALEGLPNPFVGMTRLSFALARPATTDLRVFSVDGREVRGLVSGARAAGRYTVDWDGLDAHGNRAPAGIYFVRLAVDDGAITQRVVKLD